MVTPEQFTQFALSFAGTIAVPHFERTAFKVINKRIFATLHEESETVNLKFSQVDQSVYCLINKDTIYAVENKWGLQGWTTFKLREVDSQIMIDALNTAYNETLQLAKKNSHKKL